MITKQDVLEALGFETNDRFLAGFMLGIGVGALVGGVVAVLVSPRSGPELRNVIREKGQDLVDKARTRLGNGGKEVAGAATTPPGKEPIT